MKTKLTKDQAEEKIKEFFRNIKKKKPEQVRKIKRLSMHYNIKLGKLRKKFCKHCFSPELKVKSVKRGMKTIECENCGKLSKLKISI